jgi:uncharacterized spore protein YtfJ
MEDEIQRYSAHLGELVSERTKKLTESERRFRKLSDLLPQIVFEIEHLKKQEEAQRYDEHKMAEYIGTRAKQEETKETGTLHDN